MKKQSSSAGSANRPLKVGFVFDDSLDSSDGVSQYVKTLGSWLSDQGHTVNYLVGETKMEHWSGGEVYSLSKNQKVSFNHNRLSIPLPADKKRIKQILQKENYDILHVQMPYSPFMAGRVIKYAGNQTAVIGTFHILPANKIAAVGSYLLRLLYGRTLRRFDSVVSVSGAAADFAEKVFNISPHVLPNVVDFKRFSSVKKSVKKDTKIVFLGRLVKRKGCLELLKAYESARRKGLDAKLVVAGSGPERENLENFVRNDNLNESVEFLGFVAETDKPALLAGANIACFPATGGESFGIVLIEAMAAGAKVVLGGNNPGYHSVLGGKPALLVNPSDTENFAEKLMQLIYDKPLIDDIDIWLREEVKKYDVEPVGRELLSIYRSAIAKRVDNLHNRDHE